MNETQDEPSAEAPAPEPVASVTRRRVLLAGGSVVALAFTGGVAWLASGPGGRAPRIADALATLERLEAADTIASTGEWTPFRIFSHLAQSIELSISGYPEHKSDLFKNTLGATAYSVFRKRGRMSHDLAELIPGAALIPAEGDLSLALQRLRKALLDFDRFEGEPAPHFAYGRLSKSQYAAAHVMHLDNHMREIVV